MILYPARPKPTKPYKPDLKGSINKNRLQVENAVAFGDATFKGIEVAEKRSEPQGKKQQEEKKSEVEAAHSAVLDSVHVILYVHAILDFVAADPCSKKRCSSASWAASLPRAPN